METNMTKKGTMKKATDRPMKVTGKAYTSVDAMVRGKGDAEFAATFAKYQADRQLVNCLTVIRGTNEVSQTELADRMGCAQSKVSKMESSVDADLNFGDVIKYVVGMNQAVHISFSPQRKNGAAHIRFHIQCIKHELNRLVRIAGDDRTIGDGVESLAIETVQHMVKVVESTLDRLPHRSHQSEAPVSVEAEGERGERLPIDSPRRARRVHKKAMPVV